MIDQARSLREIVAGSTTRRSAVVVGPERPHGSRCRTIAVTSGKGGVGKSNVALMLSIALGRLKKKVLLLDADLGLANIHILLGLAPKGSIRDLLSAKCDLDKVVCDGPGGIQILPGASGLEQMANLDALALEVLGRRLQGLESKYDFMILDTGAGIGRTTTEFCRYADTTLLVLTPEPTSLADAYAMVKVLYEKKMTSIAVLVNMMRAEREGREVFDKLNTLVVKFLKDRLSLLDMIPYDAGIPRLIRRQKSLIIEQPNHRISVRMQACARKLCGVVPSETTGFFARLFRTADGAVQE